jgi:hypothetical protein
MILCRLIDCDFNGSKFISTDLRWSYIENTILKEATNLTNANFNHAVLGYNTDLTDNLYLGLSFLLETVIVTKKINMTFCKRMKANEGSILKLEKQVDELLIIISNMTLSTSADLNNDSVYDIYNIRSVVSDYIGREDVLANLKTYFNLNHSDVPIAVVFAVGGTGKTQVVLRYAFDNKLDYVQDGKYRVYWIAAETIASLVSSYRDLAQRLKISTIIIM